MKRIVIPAVILIFAGAVAGFAEGMIEEENKVRDGGPRNLVSANLFAPIVGIYSGSYERAIDDEFSAYVNPQYFNYNLGIQRVFAYDERFSWWSLQSDFGVNYYLEGALEEIYVGGGPVLGYERIEWDEDAIGNPSASGVTLGAQAHVGYLFIFEFDSIAPQAGIRYTTTLTGVNIDDEFEGVDTTYFNNASDVSGNLQFPLGIKLSIAF